MCRAASGWLASLRMVTPCRTPGRRTAGDAVTGSHARLVRRRLRLSADKAASLDDARVVEDLPVIRSNAPGIGVGQNATTRLHKAAMTGVFLLARDRIVSRHWKINAMYAARRRSSGSAGLAPA